MTARKLGNVGTHLLWENEHVRVWNLVLEPGQSSDWHHHTTHYLFIVLEPSMLRTEYDDGTWGDSDSDEGEVVMGHKDSVHRVTNIGKTRYKNVIIELKP